MNTTAEKKNHHENPYGTAPPVAETPPTGRTRTLRRAGERPRRRDRVRTGRHEARSDLGGPEGGRPGDSSRLHKRAHRARDLPARRPDGARDDDGIDLRHRRRLLGGEARRQRGRDGGADRVPDGDRLYAGVRTGDRHDGHGRAPRRREGSGRLRPQPRSRRSRWGWWFAVAGRVRRGASRRTCFASWARARTCWSTGAGFARVMLGGSASVFMLFVINAAFRGAGDAAVAMRVLMFANGLNIVLGPLFIFGVGPFSRAGRDRGGGGDDHRSKRGRVARGLAALAGAGHIGVHRRHLSLRFSAMTSLARLCAAGTFQNLLTTTAWIGLIRVLATFGSVVVAGIRDRDPQSSSSRCCRPSG